jgi:hypothetical protein
VRRHALPALRAARDARRREVVVVSDARDATPAAGGLAAERQRSRLADELRSMGVHLSTGGALILTGEGAWDASARPALADILATS